MNSINLEQWSRWWAEFTHVAGSGMRIILIIVAAAIAVSILNRAIRTFRSRVAERLDDREAKQRADTLGRVVRYVVAVVVWLVAATAVLSEIGVSVAPILGAAGVVGLAVGFGAQSLVKDYFTGFFLLLENQIRQGDVVKLGEHAGFVEEVTLRYVRMRDYDGHVHFVPNGTITTVVSMSRSFAFAVVDIGVAYRHDLDKVMRIMSEVAEALRLDITHGHRILEPFELAGVERWVESAIVIRGRFKVAPLEQWTVRREYLRRLKHAFDEQAIEIPYPHLTIYAGTARPDRDAMFPIEVKRGRSTSSASPDTPAASP